MKLPIEHIAVGVRHRKEMGDLSGLAASISEIGLLQPIGVTEDNRLIFGERRLRACRDILGWTEIEARVIDMPSIVVGEQAENEVRKDFTPSERVAIADAIMAELGDRRGVNQHTKPAEHPQKLADAPVGRETRDFAAKRAGFGNHETYRQAKTVIEKAEPELVEAMDAGKITVFAAYKASKEEPEVQRVVARTGRTYQDLDRQNAAEDRRQAAAENPLVKCETITLAVTDIANTGLSPEDFKRLAARPTFERFQRSAFAAYAFLKPLVEVGNDQARAG